MKLPDRPTTEDFDSPEHRIRAEVARTMSLDKRDRIATLAIGFILGLLAACVFLV